MPPRDEQTRQTIVTGQRPAEKLPLAQRMRRGPTAAEAKLWSCLRADRLNGLHFRRQQVIDGFIVDFYCHAAGVAVESDGAVHQQQTDYDAERDRILQERGLRVLRFSNTEVETARPSVLARTAAACAPLPKPPPREAPLPSESFL